MLFPEFCEQIFKADDLGIEHDKHRFGVTSKAFTHFVVGGVRGGPACVPSSCGVHAIEFSEGILGPPKAAHSDDDLLETIGERLDHRGVQYRVPAVDHHGFRPANRCRRRLNCIALAFEEHRSNIGNVDVAKDLCIQSSATCNRHAVTVSASRCATLST